MKILYISLMSFSLLLSNNQVGFVNSSVSIPNLSIPYDGMTLKWLYDFKIFMGTPETVVYQKTENWVNIYTKKDLTTIKVKAIYPDEETTYEIDVVTRRIISESGETSFTDEWIQTNVSIGERINIRNTTATVVSKNEEQYLNTKRGSLTLRCFRLEALMKFGDKEEIWTYYFDMNTGINVNTVQDYVELFEGYPARVHVELRLIETNIDNDEDGLTDYDELFATLTHPLKSDSDGDLWNDSLDMMPNNFLLPNALIIASVVIISISGIMTYKFLKRRKALTKIESSHDV